MGRRPITGRITTTAIELQAMSSTKNSDFTDFCEALFSGQIVPSKRPIVRCEEHVRIVEKWRKAFASKLHEATGEWRVGGYDWHVFTFGYAQASTGKSAIESYNQLGKKEGYVFTHTVKEPLCCFTSCIPSYVAMTHAISLFPDLADIYVADRSFGWTFVLTHETSSGIGPFFSLPSCGTSAKT
jgi:hypothetical protein